MNPKYPVLVTAIAYPEGEPVAHAVIQCSSTLHAKLVAEKLNAGPHTAIDLSMEALTRGKAD